MRRAPSYVVTDVQHYDYFKTCIYTPPEYARDQRDSFWNNHDGKITYASVHSYFTRLAREQQKILDTRADSKVFCQAITGFSSLQNIHISCVDGVHKTYLWFAPRVFLDWEYSFPIHLETIMNVFAVAKRHGIFIKCLEISGFYAHFGPREAEFRELMSYGLSDTKSVRLIDSSCLFHFMSTIHLPALRHVELESCWITGNEVEKFLEKNSGVQTLHLENIWLPGSSRPKLDRIGEFHGTVVQWAGDHFPAICRPGTVPA